MIIPPNYLTLLRGFVGRQPLFDRVKKLRTVSNRQAWRSHIGLIIFSANRDCESDADCVVEVDDWVDARQAAITSHSLSQRFG